MGTGLCRQEPEIVDVQPISLDIVEVHLKSPKSRDMIFHSSLSPFSHTSLTLCCSSEELEQRGSKHTGSTRSRSPSRLKSAKTTWPTHGSTEQSPGSGGQGTNE